MKRLKQHEKDLKEAELYLKLSKEAENSQNPQKRTVATFLYIQCLIKANDALCERYLGETPNKHGDTAYFFKRLYQEDYIDKKYSRHRDKLTKWIQEKSKAQYQSKIYKPSDTRKLRKQTKRFLRDAKKILKRQ